MTQRSPLLLVPWLMSIFLVGSLHAAPAGAEGAAQRDAADLAVFERKAAAVEPIGEEG